MRFFPLLDFQYVALAAFLALATVATLWVFFRSYYTPRRESQTPKDKTIKFLDHLEEGHNPFPAIIVLVLGGLIVWVAIYVTFVGIKGPTF